MEIPHKFFQFREATITDTAKKKKSTQFCKVWKMGAGNFHLVAGIISSIIIWAAVVYLVVSMSERKNFEKSLKFANRFHSFSLF